MPFCTSCGNPIEKTTLVCDKCGANIVASSPSIPVAESKPATAAPPAKKGGALKVVLTILAVLVVIAIIGVAGVVGTVYYMARNTSVEEHGDSATLKTPLGDIQAGGDAKQVAADMGVELYPGARVEAGSGGLSVGSLKAGTIILETSDPADKVMAFYKEQFPKAAVTVQQDNKQVMTVNTTKGVVVITTESLDERTKITLANVSATK
jgi:hypothetical protein